MHISSTAEARLKSFAEQEGLDPSAMIEKILTEYNPREINDSYSKFPLDKVDESDPLLVRLNADIASAPTDPKEIREAEEDLEELMRNMNANRASVGARIPFPGLQ